MEVGKEIDLLGDFRGCVRWTCRMYRGIICIIMRCFTRSISQESLHASICSLLDAIDDILSVLFMSRFLMRCSLTLKVETPCFNRFRMLEALYITINLHSLAYFFYTYNLPVPIILIFIKHQHANQV